MSRKCHTNANTLVTATRRGTASGLRPMPGQRGWIRFTSISKTGRKHVCTASTKVLRACTGQSPVHHRNTSKPVKHPRGGRRQALIFAQRKSCSGTRTTIPELDAQRTQRLTKRTGFCGYTTTHRSTTCCGHVEACRRGMPSQRSQNERRDKYDAEQCGERQSPMTRAGLTDCWRRPRCHHYFAMNSGPNQT